MKKIICITIFTLIVCGAGAGKYFADSTARADTTITQDITKLTQVEINITWNDDWSAVTSVTVSGQAIILDDSGNVIGGHAKSAGILQLPAARQTEVSNLAKYIANQINIDTVNEDVTPDIP